MIKVFIAVAAVLLSGSAAADPAAGTSAEGGLSGFVFLPGTAVLEEGCLRVQGRLNYIDLKNSSATQLVLPLNVTWGLLNGFEIGGEIPFYIDDSEGDRLLGDVTAGCAWLYETARGGSAIVLRGGLRLPTGLEGRDRGSELVLGATTSTTFRLFRLQASASYILNGGRNPFEERLIDYMDFSLGGASYVTEDIQIVCAMDGDTRGDFGLSGSGVLYIFDGVSMFGVLRAGLDGRETFSISAGAAWTGSGL
ncbi:hypothetical protein DRQ25_15375 [Candidatus Fermentibacteria bacterium]|nr:MAG: hypothetical protein DRQ25_15375 [Candidatus Fermentibacteria bacterium]